MARIDNASRPLKTAALFLGLWTSVIPAGIHPAAFFPADTINSHTFLSAAGLPFEMVQAVLMMSIVAALWLHYRALLPERLTRRQGFMLLRSGAWLVTFLVIVLAGGWIVTEIVGKRAVSRGKDILIKRTRIASAAIDIVRVGNLTASLADLKNPDYLGLKDQLISMRDAAPDTRFFYIMALKKGNIVILTDSEPPESRDCSPPGQVYHEAPKGLARIFISGAAHVEGPYTDRWGTWISTFIPQKDPSTGRVVAVFGADIDARSWTMDMAGQRLPPILSILLICILLLAFYQFQKNVFTLTMDIAASEARYRGVIENITDVFIRTDLNDHVLMISPSARSMFGVESTEKAIGRDTRRFWKDPEEQSELIGIIAEKGMVQDFHATLKRVDGTEFKASLSCVYYRDETTGQIDGVEGIIRDITQSEKADQELRKLMRAMEQSPTSIVITDTAGIIEYVNPKFEDLTGYSREEALGRNPRILKSGETSQDLYRELWQTITSGKTWKGELHNRRKDGSLFWELASISPVFDRAGTIINYLAVKEDITEKKRVSDALQESEQRYRQIIENASDVLYRTDANGFFTFINTVAERITGYTPEEVVGKHFGELLPPEYRESIAGQYIRQFRERKLTTYMEVPLRKKTGDIVWVGQNVQLLLEGKKVAGFQAVARDITDRRKAEDALSRQSTLLTGLLDSIPDSVFFKDKDGVYLGCNPAFVKSVGLSREEIINRTDSELFGSEIADLYLESDRRMIELGTPTHSEEWVTYPDGNNYLIDTLKAPLRTQDGELIRDPGCEPRHDRTHAGPDEAAQPGDVRKLLMELSTEFVKLSAEDIDSGMKQGPHSVGKFCDFDCGRVFLIDRTMSFASNTTSGARGHGIRIGKAGEPART
jgi:PAS domain S-box-containing protein